LVLLNSFEGLLTSGLTAYALISAFVLLAAVPLGGDGVIVII
jgi:hypothetical protein